MLLTTAPLQKKKKKSPLQVWRLRCRSLGDNEWGKWFQFSSEITERVPALQLGPSRISPVMTESKIPPRTHSQGCLLSSLHLRRRDISNCLQRPLGLRAAPLLCNSTGSPLWYGIRRYQELLREPFNLCIFSTGSRAEEVAEQKCFAPVINSGLIMFGRIAATFQFWRRLCFAGPCVFVWVFFLFFFSIFFGQGGHLGLIRREIF